MKLLYTLIILFAFSFGQQYEYGRIELKNGGYIEGKNLLIYDDIVYININKNMIVKNKILDIKTIWKGRPSNWEIRRGLIIGSSIGLIIGIVDGTSLGSNDTNAFGMIPFLGIIGYLNDLRKNLNKYSGITSNWQTIYNTNNINKINIDGSNRNKYDELEELFELKEKGIITDEEYEIEKAKILDSK